MRKKKRMKLKTIQPRMAEATVDIGGVRSADPWEVICDTPEEAAEMRAQSRLMMRLAWVIRKHRWRRARAAQYCGVPQTRIAALQHGRFSAFSLEELQRMAAVLRDSTGF